MDESAGQVTQILDAVGAGDAQAAEKLLPLVYDELRRLAAAKMANEPPLRCPVRPDNCALFYD